MPTTCFCYTVDRHYALPTLLSAIQARAHLSPVKADVLILYVGANDEIARASARVCSRYKILFQLVEPGAIDNLTPNFARHFLDHLLDAHYTDVMHVDGDTQIIASLDPVIDAPLPAGRILAAPDPMAIMIDAPGRAWAARRHYFESIGILGDQPGRYVNSGVFRVKRSDIGAIGRECLRICKSQKGKTGFRRTGCVQYRLSPPDRSHIVQVEFSGFLPEFRLRLYFPPSVSLHVEPSPVAGCLSSVGIQGSRRLPRRSSTRTPISHRS